MKKSVTFDYSGEARTFVSETKNYFTSNGFGLVKEEAETLVFKRGSMLLNLVTFNPLKWKSRIEISFTNNKVTAEFDISTFGQMISSKEVELWNSFTLNYQRMMTEGKDVAAENQAQLKEAKRSSLSYIKWAVLGGLLAGVPAGFVAYFTGIDTIAPAAAAAGAVGLMRYKMEEENKKQAAAQDNQED